MSQNNSKKSTYLHGINLEKNYSEKGSYFVILINENNEPIPNEDVFIDIISEENSSGYYRKTNDIGVAELHINLRVGKFQVVSTFEGNNKYLSSTTKNTIIINALPEPEPEPEVEVENLEEELNEEFLDENEWDDLANNELMNKSKKKRKRKEIKVWDEVMIEVNNVTMDFDFAKERVDNLKEYVIKGIKGEIEPKTKFRALDNISFTVNRGERLGVIGFNGAGKSTLLKILSRVMKPTKGSITLNGNVAPLLELGAGFDHNYSGNENIYLNGAILGYKKEFLESKHDEIVKFSELGEFIDIPIKNYSSGMQAKLGFSIATIVEPDILILDEVLSVGDVKFQQKSAKKLTDLMESGVTVVLVSHSVATVRKLCNKVIWLDHGKLIMSGDVDDVCDEYIRAASKASAEELRDLDLN